MGGNFEPAYGFSLRNEYGIDETREIYRQFQFRFLNSSLASNMNKWPVGLESQVENDLNLSDDNCTIWRSQARNHEQTRVWLLQEMVKRIKLHDEEQELQKLRDVKDYEMLKKIKRRWFQQRFASRQKAKLLRKKNFERWIKVNFFIYNMDDGTELYVGKN